MTVDIYNELVNLVSDKNVEHNKSLKNHTYTRLGGSADYFVTPETYEHEQQIVKFVNEHNIPFTLLGIGSNLIVRDGGIRGIVMYLGKLMKIDVTDTTLVAQSGALIADVSKAALEAHLTGLEFACGIPGSVGGALFMNAGAYGGEIKDVLESALVVDRHGDIKRVLAKDLDLAYRTSNIPDNRYVVLEATFQLEAGNYDEIKVVMDDLTYRRESKQ